MLKQNVFYASGVIYMDQLANEQLHCMKTLNLLNGMAMLIFNKLRFLIQSKLSPGPSSKSATFH